MGLFEEYQETHYEQYCQDGRVFNAYSVGTGYYTWDYALECIDWCWIY
jgi:hypothetical protein